MVIFLAAFVKMIDNLHQNFSIFFCLALYIVIEMLKLILLNQQRRVNLQFFNSLFDTIGKQSLSNKIFLVNAQSFSNFRHLFKDNKKRIQYTVDNFVRKNSSSLLIWSLKEGLHQLNRQIVEKLLTFFVQSFHLNRFLKNYCQ